MAQNFEYLCSTPVEEDCAQVGEENYEQRAKRECRALIGQLIRMYGEPPEGVTLVTKGFPHDFGTYYEVIVNFDDANRKQTAYACMLVDGLPDLWDEQAREELGLNEKTA